MSSTDDRSIAEGADPAVESRDDARQQHASSAVPSVVTGRLLVVVATLLWSSSGLFAKAPIFDDWPADTRGLLLAFWRALFAGVLMIPAVRRPTWDARLVPLCVAFTAMNVTYLSAMSLTTAANSIWLQSTAPWWVCLVGVVVFREPLAHSERFPLVIGGIGLAVILAFQMQGQDRTGILLGLLSGFSYAGVVMSLRALRTHDAVWLVVVCHVAAALALLPYVLYIDVWPGAAQFPVLAAFGLFQMALPYVFFARGLRAITSQEATGIGLLEPILLPVWVYLAWHEVPAPSTLVGGGLILTGLALRYLVPVARQRKGIV